MAKTVWSGCRSERFSLMISMRSNGSIRTCNGISAKKMFWARRSATWMKLLLRFYRITMMIRNATGFTGMTMILIYWFKKTLAWLIWWILPITLRFNAGMTIHTLWSGRFSWITTTKFQRRWAIRIFQTWATLLPVRFQTGPKSLECFWNALMKIITLWSVIREHCENLSIKNSRFLIRFGNGLLRVIRRLRWVSGLHMVKTT